MQQRFTFCYADCSCDGFILNSNRFKYEDLLLNLKFILMAEENEPVESFTLLVTVSSSVLKLQNTQQLLIVPVCKPNKCILCLK